MGVGSDGLPAVNLWWFNVQSLAQQENCFMEGQALCCGPEVKLVTAASTAEAIVATDVQVRHEISWRVATVEGAASAEATSQTSYGREADQRQHLFHRDASPECVEVDTGHDINACALELASSASAAAGKSEELCWGSRRCEPDVPDTTWPRGIA